MPSDEPQTGIGGAEPHPSDEQPQFLHPISLLFIGGSALIRSIFPMIAAMIAVPPLIRPVVFMFILGPAAGSTLLRYFGFRYRLGAEDLVVREGILSRNERHIPYSRIQNIDIVQNPVHKFFDVALARVQTASGSKPEATIRVLSLEAIEQIRRRVFAGRKTAEAIEADQQDEREPLVRLSASDLVLFGIINNRGMVFVAAALGLASQLGMFDRITDSIEQIVRTTMGLPALDEWPWVQLIILGMVGLLVLLFALRVFSVGVALFKYSGFTVRLHGDDLRTSYGLVNTISGTIPRHRIQRLIVRSTPLHRLLGLSSIQIETAGGLANEEGSEQRRKQWLAPVIDAERVDDVVRSVLPDIEMDAVEWESLADRAKRRVGLRSFRGGLIATGIAAAIFGVELLLLILTFAPLAIVHGVLYFKHSSYAVSPTALFHRRGWFVRRLSIVRFSKMQVLSLVESPFDRRYGMATLRVDTAGSAMASGHGIDVPFMDADRARNLLIRLSKEASSTSFRW